MDFSTIADPNHLTPSITTVTTTPFPLLKAVNNEEKSGILQSLEEYPSDNVFVTAKVCSELMEHTRPVTRFDAGEELVLLTDSTGQPMVFSIGTDKHLYLLIHVDGARQGWQQFDITPPGQDLGVTAFDVFEARNGMLYIAAAQEQHDETTIMFHGSFPKPLVSFDEESRILLGAPTEFNWTSITNNLTPQKVTSVICGPPGILASTTSTFSLFVGTAKHGANAGAYHSINTDPAEPKPWTAEAGPEVTDEVQSLKSALISGQAGKAESAYVYLYQTTQGFGCSLRRTDPATGQRGPFSRFATGVLGQPRAICTSLNPFGFTDVLIGGDDGVCFYDYRNLSGSPVGHFLQGVKVKQVVCSERKLNDKQTSLSIFVVSDKDELFFVNGTRTTNPFKLEFPASALPLRRNVARVSTQFSRAKGTSEVLYTGNGQSELYHLSRDQATSLWSEAQVLVPHMDKVKTQQAFVTTLTLTDDKGQAVPAGYPVSFTSEPQLLIANDRSYQFDSRPTEVRTNSRGRITLVTLPDESYAAPTIFFSLPKHKEDPPKYAIYPAQRVMRQMARYKTADDLRNGKDANGNPWFTGNISDSNLQDAAGLMTQFPGMLNTVDSKAAAATLDKNDLTKIQDFELGIEKAENKAQKVKKTSGNWFVDAISISASFVGDVLEFVKWGFQSTLRLAFVVVGPVLKFLIKHGDEAFAVTINSVTNLLGTVNGLIKDLTGVDIGKMFGWGFDVAKIKQTQVYLQKFCIETKNHSLMFLDQNRSTLTQGIGKVRSKVEPIIKDTRPPAEVPDPERPGSSFLQVLLDNPITEFLLKFNPLSWLLEVIGEEFGDMVKFPNLGESLMKIHGDIMSLLRDEMLNISRLVQDLVAKVKTVWNDRTQAPKVALEFVQNAFWTIFDGVARCLTAIYDIFTHQLEGMFELVMGTWKIPFITTLFEQVAKQPFSLMNLVSFGMASYLNIAFQVTNKKMPFEVLPDPMSFFDGMTRERMDMKGIFGLGKDDDELEKYGAPEGVIKAETNMSAETKAALKIYYAVQHTISIIIGVTRLAACGTELLYPPVPDLDICPPDPLNHEPKVHDPRHTIVMICDVGLIISRLVGTIYYVCSYNDPLLQPYLEGGARGCMHTIPLVIDVVGAVVLVVGKQPISGEISNTLHCLGIISNEICSITTGESNWGYSIAEIIGSIFGIGSQWCPDRTLGAGLLAVDGVLTVISLSLETIFHDSSSANIPGADHGKHHETNKKIESKGQEAVKKEL
ncbi:hypothetical protein PVAG01_09714 [Phlyctema vagabunda]|uniref:Uncharacterized protein n=1 Tax=Phlyctema vagabunda TaxID=108571 RepID=A0ABR4P840_9HELO